MVLQCFPHRAAGFLSLSLRQTINKGKGNLNRLFSQPEKYRRGSGLSMTPTSGLYTLGEACEKDRPGPGAKDVANDEVLAGGGRFDHWIPTIFSLERKSQLA
jgi:hypothetical protein